MNTVITLFLMFNLIFIGIGVLGILERIFEKPLERIVDMLDLDD